MKAFSLFLLLLSGCVQNLDTRTQKASADVDAIISNAVPVAPPLPFIESPQGLSQPMDFEEVIAPPTEDRILHMEYSTPLTNCWLESTASLTPPVRWANYYDFYVTNGDWKLFGPKQSQEYFRVCGEPR
jgi:hypothetical protein